MEVKSEAEKIYCFGASKQMCNSIRSPIAVAGAIGLHLEDSTL